MNPPAVDAALKLRPAYHEALAFMAGAALGSVPRKDGITAVGVRAAAVPHTPARRFIEMCGDRGVLRVMVRMLVG